MKIIEPMLLSFNGTSSIVQNAQNPEVIRKAKAGDEDAINLIIDENEGLISSIAIAELDKTPVIVDTDDLMQAGKLGFMEAIKDYDSTKGTKLTTYATYWIRSHIQQEIVAARTIRIPIKGISSTQGQRTRRVHSIHATKSDDSLPKENFLESKEEDVTSTVARNDFQREFHRKINELVKEQIITEKEKEILFMRFGVNRPSGLTLEEISETFNPPIAISKIERLINEVIEKLKLHLISLEDNLPTISQTQVAQNNALVTEVISPILIILTTTGKQTSEKEIEGALSYIRSRSDLKEILNDKIDELINQRNLNERQKQILFMYFGINQSEKYTKEQIGNSFSPPILASRVHGHINTTIRELRSSIFNTESSIYKALKKVKEELLANITELKEKGIISEREYQVLQLYFQSWFEVEKPLSYDELGLKLSPKITGEAVRQNIDRGMQKLTTGLHLSI